jgi:hypothetical protein
VFIADDRSCKTIKRCIRLLRPSDRWHQTLDQTTFDPILQKLNVTKDIRGGANSTQPAHAASSSILLSESARTGNVNDVLDRPPDPSCHFTAEIARPAVRSPMAFAGAFNSLLVNTQAATRLPQAQHTKGRKDANE